MAQCPSCQADNPAGARFCNQCGTRLAAGGAPGPAGPARSYTPKHLADKVLQARAAMQGERKRVTVLFADIKGSTRLAEQAGAEAWHAILDRFFTLLSEAVHRYEGTVNQYTGDGIMALFGAPVAHEDHAQRACFAALAMQSDVRRFADELRLRHGLNLTLRVGLNTGEVIVGRIGDDLRMDYTAQGLTVNLAARMEQICEPGHVYLTRNTAALVEGYFRLRDLGQMEVAGASQAVTVYDLEGEGPIRTRLERQMARIGSRFVGREREMSALHDALERARGGRGPVVAVIGNAGIGKSRLCLEFTEACTRTGIPVHRATGVPYAGALPLYPVQTLLRSRLNLPERCSDEEARRLVAGTFLLQDPANAAILPSILEFLGVGAARDRTPEAAAEAREKMFALLARWLPQAEGPQILLVEDLHFADPATEDFLERLCREVARTRTLLLLNYRPDFVSEALIPHLEEQIQVTALTEAQIADLVRAALGSHASLAGVAERIAARAGGNPYFAEEAVQALVDEGHVRGQTGAYELLRPIESWTIPDTVHALISARIDRLGEAHKTLLQTAAVIGQEFPPGLLGSLSALEAEPLEAGLNVLEECGFVHARSEASAESLQYRFCHPLVQEVAYQTQLEAQRAGAHGRLAAALESAHPLSAPPDEAAVKIAHHWERAGEWARAGCWNLQAARWYAAHDVSGTGEQSRLAIRNFDRAPDSPEVLKGRILARAGLVRVAQFVPTTHDEVHRAYEEARAMAERARDVAALAELHLAYANEQLHCGDAESAVRVAGDAVRQAVAAGAAEVVHRFRLAVLLVYNTAGYPREGLEIVNAAAGTSWMTEPIGMENYLSRGFYGLMLGPLGEIEKAEQLTQEALEFAERQDRAASWMHANLVDLCWFSGNHDRAMVEARRAVERAELAGSPFFRIIALRALGLAHCLHGSAHEAIPVMEAQRAIVAPGALAHQFEGAFLGVLASAYRGAGREAEAEAAAWEAVSSAQRSKARVWELRAWISWFELPVSEARRPRAREGLARLAELVDSSGAEGFRPWLWLARARWSDTPAQAEAHHRQALETFRRVGAHGHVRRLASGSVSAR